MLELAALTGMGIWGYHLTSGFTRFLWAFGIPVLAAIVWWAFNVPGDPSRSGKAPVRIRGWLRLLLELFIFIFAAWAYHKSIDWKAGIVFASLVVIHYLFSLRRIVWLYKK